jgi:hypothetical protein
MAETRLHDLDEEKLLLHFVLPNERELVLECMRSNGGERPEGAEERMDRADDLMERAKLAMSDQKAALLLSLSALHCLDFSDGARALMHENLKARAWTTGAKLVSNLALIFLKRQAGGSDHYNSLRACDLLETFFLPKIPQAERAKLLPKLHLRRTQALLDSGDFRAASVSVKRALELVPNDAAARAMYERCRTELMPKKQQAPAPLLKRAAWSWVGVVAAPENRVLVASVIAVLVVGVAMLAALSSYEDSRVKQFEDVLLGQLSAP